MKIGVNLKVDVTKLDKARFFKGKKGTYVDLTAFIDIDNPNEFGDNGTISQRGDKGEKMPIVGNTKVFWSDAGQAPQQAAPQQQPKFDDPKELDDNCPF